MDLFLHTPDSDSKLSEYYQRAFEKAVELFIVTAYLTEWDTSLKLNANCRSFRVIIGKDFGITRKEACKAIMNWLPSKRKGQFMVADLIKGFHPKAVFWKESNGKNFAIVGSSNLTRAAFETNYEANVFSQISDDEYTAAKQWVRSIEKRAIAVSEDWLGRYKEAAPTGGGRQTGKGDNEVPLVVFKLPEPDKGIEKRIDDRREQMKAYEEKSEKLIRLSRRYATGKIDSDQFYAEPAIPGGQSSGTVSGMMPPQELALSGQRDQGGTL